MRRAFFQCDLGGVSVPLRPVWKRAVGSGRAALALRADWQSQFRRCREDLGIECVRFHGLLSDNGGIVVRGDDGPLYTFFNVERIWDFLLSAGARPFVELSFMPQTLASGKATVFSYAGNVTPPRNSRLWTELVRRLARHAIGRYGLAEVRQWHFEVWNEPNLRSFWRGTRQGYFDLYAATARALKEVDPELRVGGPATSENAWLGDFLSFCERLDIPADFISTHYYATDPTRQVSNDTEDQLAAGRRSILRERATDARMLVGKLPLWYTEWNTSSNERDPLHDDPYAAAFVIKTMLEVSSIVDAYSFWTFTDIFDESYFPSQPFHGGFGLLSLHGIAKPTHRAFQLLNRLGAELIVPVDGIHPTVDCWVARDQTGISVLLANHTLPRHEIETVVANVRLESAAPPKRATVTRIDADHANPKRLWVAMGSPEYLTERQLTDLHDASTLSVESLPFRTQDRSVTMEISVPPHGVALVALE